MTEVGKSANGSSRRDFLKAGSAAVAAATVSGWTAASYAAIPAVAATA